ncbi:probable E3 ubiquitin-protein ligase EDA40 [Punica granatum]|uniref:Uncharacterized protein n=2 Tax=Punica granatum TaxID=22663 RepID=A0A2I0KUD0_PUNGR|nr:probable E3 ubiquitin-protein ligase EDA40 [Punica granatum]PKI71446.1 hypothetical protein CRG98_008119 [Punica granatum]
MGLRKAAKKMVVAACASFSRKQALVDPSVLDTTHHISKSSAMSPLKQENNISGNAEEAEEPNKNKSNASSKNICAICLDPLSYSTASSPGQAIFTAQCSHAFHFACISSNVRHGSVTCPICRAHWTQLPRNLNPSFSLACNRTDPVLRILDDSIANFRVHRRSFLRSARYDDDDPIEPDSSFNYPRLDFSLMPIQPVYPSFHSYHPCEITTLPVHNNLTGSSSLLHQLPRNYAPVRSSRRAYLSVKLSHQQATDMVLVASPNGPHLRLLKQSMALIVFSLRPIDRLAIVTYSSAAARIFPLKRMTSYGKRAALQVIDRLFYTGQADPTEGFKKGIKILEDRAHKNPHSCILHLSDSPTRSYHSMNTETPIPVHQFHVGFGFGASNGFVMHEFEKFLARVLGGVIREVQLRIGEEGSVIRLGELRGGEERRIVLDLREDEHVCIAYSYAEGGTGECMRTGEAVVSVGDKRERRESRTEGGVGRDVSIIGGRSSCVESWDYHDPFMARRWAKHLHGYRL